ncbi:MAG: TolC family protein [Prevotellaceae bacterium]|nr:TolC family protein [Prevotellaceae bacterium]
MKTARNQGLQARQAITENRAKLLPQLNGFASFDDNFEPPVSATDQSDNGAPYYITHTLQYAAGMGIQLSMPLYDQTLLTSMQLVKQASEMSVLQEEKVSEDLLENTAKMSFMAQVTHEQISLIEKNIQSLTELRDQTYALGENGMALEVEPETLGKRLSRQ